jgi:CheY-like chemotaxis protein
MREGYPLVFIVDDEEGYIMYLKTGLLQQGVRNVMTFIDGESCIANLNLNLKPDVIILDYHLNTKNVEYQDGFRLAEKIKKMLPSTKIVLLSGEVHNELERFVDKRFINFIDRYMVKGLGNISDLVDTIFEYSS